MLRTKSGLPKHCSWNVDRHGKRRVRFRKAGFTDLSDRDTMVGRFHAPVRNGARWREGTSRTTSGPDARLPGVSARWSPSISIRSQKVRRSRTVPLRRNGPGATS